MASFFLFWWVFPLLTNKAVNQSNVFVFSLPWAVTSLPVSSEICGLLPILGCWKGLVLPPSLPFSDFGAIRERHQKYGWCFWYRGERTLDLSWHHLLSRRGTNTRKTEVPVGLWYCLPSLLGTQPHFLDTYFSEYLAHLQPISCLHTQMDISFRLALHCNCLPYPRPAMLLPRGLRTREAAFLPLGPYRPWTVTLQSTFFYLSVYFSKCYTKYVGHYLINLFLVVGFMIAEFYLLLEIVTIYVQRRKMLLFGWVFSPSLLKKWWDLQINMKCFPWSHLVFKVGVIASHFLVLILKLVIWKLNIKNSRKRERTGRAVLKRIF